MKTFIDYILENQNNVEFVHVPDSLRFQVNLFRFSDNIDPVILLDKYARCSGHVDADYFSVYFYYYKSNNIFPIILRNNKNVPITYGEIDRLMSSNIYK